MKRFVLVDRKGNRLCGDTAAAGTHTHIWTSIAAHFEDDVPLLSASAARLFDRSLGKIADDYVFTRVAADQNSEGYLIFDCSCEDALPPMASEPIGPHEALNAVATKCVYVGYVRRDHVPFPPRSDGLPAV